MDYFCAFNNILEIFYPFHLFQFWFVLSPEQTNKFQSRLDLFYETYSRVLDCTLKEYKGSTSNSLLGNYLECVSPFEVFELKRNFVTIIPFCFGCIMFLSFAFLQHSSFITGELVTILKFGDSGEVKVKDDSTVWEHDNMTTRLAPRRWLKQDESREMIHWTRTAQ